MFSLLPVRRLLQHLLLLRLLLLHLLLHLRRSPLRLLHQLRKPAIPSFRSTTFVGARRST